LLDVTLFGWQFRCTREGQAVFLRKAEKARQLRSYLESILNKDQVASALGGAHKLGAPYFRRTVRS
jgi:hypothetical protein